MWFWGKWKSSVIVFQSPSKAGFYSQKRKQTSTIDTEMRTFSIQQLWMTSITTVILKDGDSPGSLVVESSCHSFHTKLRVWKDLYLVLHNWRVIAIQYSAQCCYRTVFGKPSLFPCWKHNWSGHRLLNQTMRQRSSGVNQGYLVGMMLFILLQRSV